MTSIEDLKNEIDRLKQRNTRVEKDKTWEVSKTRIALVSGLTYVIVVIFFVVAELPNPYVNALVPAIAFLLSNLTMNMVKSWWIKSIHK